MLTAVRECSGWPPPEAIHSIREVSAWSPPPPPLDVKQCLLLFSLSWVLNSKAALSAWNLFPPLCLLWISLHLALCRALAPGWAAVYGCCQLSTLFQSLNSLRAETELVYLFLSAVLACRQHCLTASKEWLCEQATRDIFREKLEGKKKRKPKGLKEKTKFSLNKEQTLSWDIICLSESVN